MRTMRAIEGPQVGVCQNHNLSQKARLYSLISPSLLMLHVNITLGPPETLL